jgi:hypothetical protein
MALELMAMQLQGWGTHNLCTHQIIHNNCAVVLSSVTYMLKVMGFRWCLDVHDKVKFA